MNDIPYNKSSCAIVHSIIDLAHNLDMKVIAEGIEHEAQNEFLKKYNCDYIQGYLFSKPVIPEKFSSISRQDFSQSRHVSNAE
jgi:EAL domain-containing protein (putative c-di-GMP-specific phosphodiesterase class I)